MTAAWCAVWVLVVLLVGWAATAAILGGQRRPIAEVLGLILLLGAGVTGTLLLWLSMFGLRPLRATVLTLGALATASLAALGWKNRLVCPVLPQPDQPWWRNLPAAVLVLALAAANAAAAIPAIGFKQFEWDAFVIWALKAKVLYYSPLTPLPEYFTDPGFSFSHQDYPLLLPMLIAAAWGTMQQINEQLGKIILPMLFAGQTLLAYSAARLWVGRSAALLLSLLLVGTPVSLTFAGMGNADSPLSGFYLGSIFYLIRWISHRQRCDMVLSALFCVFMATTKSEGLPLAAINALVLPVIAAVLRDRRAWKHLGLFATIVFLGIGLWLAWRSELPHTNDDHFSRLRPSIVAQNIGRLGTIVEAMAGQFISIANWGGLWLLAALMALLGFEAFVRTQTLLLWALLLMHLGLYVLVYVIAAWDVQDLLRVTISRLLLHASPAAMMLIAVHWPAAQPRWWTG